MPSDPLLLLLTTPADAFCFSGSHMETSKCAVCKLSDQCTSWPVHEFAAEHIQLGVDQQLCYLSGCVYVSHAVTACCSSTDVQL